ncbi:hypothetical protein AgCh_013738 [Apium graveolens]
MEIDGKLGWSMYGLGDKDDDPKSPNPQLMDGKMLEETIFSRKLMIDMFGRDYATKEKSSSAICKPLCKKRTSVKVTSELSETFPSGCLTLDSALGGGLPRGRIVEIYGPESSGKTTLALHMIAEVQNFGGNAMLVDAEHAFDPTYSKGLGVDVENLVVCKPDNGEMTLKSQTTFFLFFKFLVFADHMCRSGALELICIDSVSALTPQAEIEIGVYHGNPEVTSGEIIATPSYTVLDIEPNVKDVLDIEPNVKYEQNGKHVDKTENPHGYSGFEAIDKIKLNEMMKNKDLEELRRVGDVEGLTSALQTDPENGNAMNNDATHLVHILTRCHHRKGSTI